MGALHVTAETSENYLPNHTAKSEKNEIPRKVLPFFRKLSTGTNRSIWILPGINEIPVKWKASKLLALFG